MHEGFVPFAMPDIGEAEIDSVVETLRSGWLTTFPPEVAMYVVRLTCERPDTRGRSLSLWDGAELAHQLLAESGVEDIATAKVRRMLAGHQLKPWRHHLWLHPKQPRVQGSGMNQVEHRISSCWRVDDTSPRKGGMMLRRLWERWKAIAHIIGNFQSRVLLTLFYCLILAPFAVGVQLLTDPLRLRRQNRSHWMRRKDGPAPGWEGARRQF